MQITPTHLFQSFASARDKHVSAAFEHAEKPNLPWNEYLNSGVRVGPSMLIITRSTSSRSGQRLIRRPMYAPSNRPTRHLLLKTEAGSNAGHQQLPSQSLVAKSSVQILTKLNAVWFQQSYDNHRDWFLPSPSIHRFVNNAQHKLFHQLSILDWLLYPQLAGFSIHNRTYIHLIWLTYGNTYTEHYTITNQRNLPNTSMISKIGCTAHLSYLEPLVTISLSLSLTALVRRNFVRTKPIVFSSSSARARRRLPERPSRAEK